jgi:hypothetical protein
VRGKEVKEKVENELAKSAIGMRALTEVGRTRASPIELKQYKRIFS